MEYIKNHLKIKPWEWIAVLAAASYTGILVFPYLLFPYKITYKSYQVYSDAPIPGGINKVLEETDAAIKRSELYDPAGHYRVFISGGFLRYGFLASIHRKAYALTYPLTQNIFLSKTDLSANIVYARGNNNTRRASDVLAHEITHVMINKKLGFFRTIRLPSWKEEGYCDYIANSSSFNCEQGMVLMGKDQSAASNSFKYFKYRVLIHHLITSKKLRFQQIIDRKFALTELEKEAVSGFLKGTPDPCKQLNSK